MARRQRRRRQERRQDHAKREGFRTRHSMITGLGITATAVLGVSAPAMAANITVNNNNDPGDGTCDVAGCTLREAVNLADSTATDDDIYFASNVTGTIDLNGFDYGAIGITNPVSIHGPGPGTLTVDAQGDSGIFYTNMVTPGDDVNIEGLRLTGGSQELGGAIDDFNSAMSVYNTVLSGNEALAGGAIYTSGDYTMFTTFSTLNNNQAQYGGAIASDDRFGLLGAVTMAGNRAAVGGAVDGFGGRIFDSTISGNQADDVSGGVYAYYGYSYSSILANNTGGNPDVSSLHWYSGFSLIENPGFTSIHTDVNPPFIGPNITGQDPQLGGLANNGGPTPTLKPAGGSPVVDQGESPSVGIDQRLFARPIDNPLVANAPGGNGADIGSVELTLGEGPQPPATQQPPVVTKKKKCKKKKHKRSAESAKKKKCKKKKKRSASAATAASRARAAWEAQVPNHPGQRFRAMDRSRRSGHVDWANRAWKVGP
jgi:hypothetical protein